MGPVYKTIAKTSHLIRLASLNSASSKRLLMSRILRPSWAGHSPKSRYTERVRRERKSSSRSSFPSRQLTRSHSCWDPEGKSWICSLAFEPSGCAQPLCNMLIPWLQETSSLSAACLRTSTALQCLKWSSSMRIITYTSFQTLVKMSWVVPLTPATHLVHYKFKSSAVFWLLSLHDTQESGLVSALLLFPWSWSSYPQA